MFKSRNIDNWEDWCADRSGEIMHKLRVIDHKRKKKKKKKEEEEEEEEKKRGRERGA